MIYILAGQLVRWLAVSTWSIKTVPNELVYLAKEVSKLKVPTGSFYLHIQYGCRWMS